jgi:hypothetical protein
MMQAFGEAHDADLFCCSNEGKNVHTAEGMHMVY